MRLLRPDMGYIASAALQVQCGLLKVSEHGEKGFDFGTALVQ